MKFKKKKITKHRGTKSCGGGSKKKRRGSGHKGGKGRAGSGKKAQGKKPSFWKERRGRWGFTSKGRLEHRAINIEEVERNLENWSAQGIAAKKGNGFEVDLSKTRFTKLLATGTPSVALHIKVDFASKGAAAKLGGAGGSLEVLKTVAKKEKKKPAQKKKAAAADADDGAEAAE